MHNLYVMSLTDVKYKLAQKSTPDFDSSIDRGEDQNLKIVALPV
jgi:hypothetical protein